MNSIWTAISGAAIGVVVGSILGSVALFVGVIGLACLPYTDYTKEGRWQRLYGKTCGRLRGWWRRRSGR